MIVEVLGHNQSHLGVRHAPVFGKANAAGAARHRISIDYSRNVEETFFCIIDLTAGYLGIGDTNKLAIFTEFYAGHDLGRRDSAEL